MKKLKLAIFIILSASLLVGPFFDRITVAYSPEYKWTDANNIDAQDNDNPNNPNSNQTYTFTSKTGKEYKYTINNGGCAYITVQAKTGEAKVYVEKLVGQDCATGKYNSSDITIKGDLPTEIKNNQDLDPANNKPVNCNKNPDDSRCKDQQATDNPCWLSVGTFGWILCPILDFANTLYNWMFGIVRNLLFIPEASYNSNAGLKKSWNNMKNIASAIIVLVALVMIAAQIFNFEFVSAYTMKKALPRLVIAAIAIQLSWYIFTLLIQITNGIGAGIYNLLTLPFDNAGDILTDLTNQTDSVGYGSQSFGGLLLFLGIGSATIGALLTALSPGGWMTLVLVSIGVIISMLVALITLIVRKMLIITLLILSPVALALWILPGTQKVWAMWWQLFSKLLLMFPLIMILFAAGQIFAASLSNIDESGMIGGVNMIMIIVAFFAPLFLIPGTFKAAGGIFGQIVGAINGIGKKASGADWGLRRRRDALRKYNDETRARMEAERTRDNRGRIMNSPNPMNRIRARASLGLGGFTRRGSAALAEEAAMSRARDDKERMDKAALAHEGLTKGLVGSDRTRRQQQLLHSQLGSTVRDQSGREVEVTPELHRQILKDAMVMKNDQLVDGYFEPNGAGGPAPADLTARQEVIRRFSSDGGAEIDKRFTDISRNGTLDAPVTQAGAYQKMLENFGDISDGRDGARDRQHLALETIRNQASGYQADGTAPDGNDPIANKHSAATWIDTLGKQNLRPEVQSKIASELSPSLTGLSAQDISNVLRSEGKLQVRYDQANDTYAVHQANVN